MPMNSRSCEFKASHHKYHGRFYDLGNFDRKRHGPKPLAADCGCQELNGDYPSPVFMISTDPKHRLRLSAPRGARNRCLTCVV